MPKLLIAVLMLICGAALSSNADAQSDAPFCSVTSTGTYCWYYDLQDCQRQAARLGGGCIVNQNRSNQRPSSNNSDVWDNFEQGVRIGESMPQPLPHRESANAPPQRRTPSPPYGAVAARNPNPAVLGITRATTVIGGGLYSCDQWLSTPTNHALGVEWMLGFWSGRSVNNSNSTVGLGSNIDDITGAVAEHCGSDMSMPLIEAISKVYSDYESASR